MRSVAAPTITDLERCLRVLVVAPGLQSRGGIVSVVSLHTRMPVWREMNCTLLSTYDDRSGPRKILAALAAYLSAPFKMLRVQIVHLHVAGQLSLLRKVPIVALARLFGKVLIVHVHASSPESLFERTPQWAVCFVLGKADRVVALSASWRSIIREHVPAANVTVVPNPVLTFPIDDRSPQEKRTILFVGKLEARKGYIDLLRAASIVLQRYPELQFCFAGHGELEKAREESIRLGIHDFVRLAGWTDAEGLAQLYHEARVFCLPSSNEGLPMSVLEAMSHGVPVVCTPVGGIPELIHEGSNGCLVPPGNPEAIAAALLALLDDPIRANAIGLAGRRTVQDLCSLEIVSDQLRELYQCVCPR